MKISAIKPYEKNAKRHPIKQVRQVAKSIKAFGFNQPIVVDKDGVIIVGHGRYEAAKHLGLKDVPVIKVVLTPEQANAYRLADNKLNESEWDMKLAVDELRGLSKEMFDLTGFDADLLINPDEKDDEIPENVPARSKLGDLYELGDHRVLCGDSTQAEEVLRLMNGKKTDMVFTDPPYNVDYSGRGKNTSNKIENDNQTEQAFREFLEKAFLNYKTILKDEGGAYICYASRTHREFEDSLSKANFEIRNQIIWVKLVASMGWGDYRWKHEPMLYCHQKGNNLDFYGDRKQYTQWDEERDDKWLLKMIKAEIKKQEDGGSTVWRFGREFNYTHPTQKPVQMIVKAIINSSQSGQLVTDLFLGSGATLLASEKMSRVCYGMELDPKYVDVIVQRYVDYVNEPMVKCNDKDVTQLWKKSNKKTPKKSPNQE